MNKEINPFLTDTYISKNYFCDREQELNLIKSKIENGNNLTLISNRRLGKSALIRRFFEDFDVKECVVIYVDIFACTCLKDFTETISLAIFQRFPEKRGIGKRFFDFITGLRPVISYDMLTGQPQISLDFKQPKEYEHTLQNLFQFIDNQNINIVLAIDEFQQISIFPEKNIEAMLRTIVQTLKNTQLIFSGSKQHLMLEMFNSANRPFFGSAQTIALGEIPNEKYAEFIRQKFEENKRTITDEAINFALEWTLTHTYYTQIILNGVFAESKKNVDIETVKRVCDEQLAIQQINFMQYRDLLSALQWRLLIAIAKEGYVSEIQSQTFLQKYKIGAASSAKKALDALVEKEMVCRIESLEKTQFRVYNVFLLRWLDRIF